jgi:YD repeat-containing protein
MTWPEPPTPPSEAPEEPSTLDFLGRPTAKIEELLRKRSKLDALLQHQFRREVTVLFSDIQGSTAYFERRGDLSGRQMVQRHNDLLFPLITQQQGTVLKTIGDAIMASFADPARAVQAAIAIQRALHDHNRDQEAGEQIHIRIGLNSGRALVELQDAFGDVVNAAARVQACALPDQILISGATYRQLPATIPCRPVGAREVKGKSVPIELFEVCWDERSREPALTPVVPDVSGDGDRRNQPVVPAAPQAFLTHSPRAVGRARMVAGAAMVLVLLLLAGIGGWYWDAYYRTHVEHYANVITRWGLPEGIGRLTDEQVSHRNTTLEFTKRGRQGPVHDIRAVNSRGVSPPMFARTALFLWGDLNPLEQETTIPESILTCRVTFERDAGGRILNQRAYNCAGRELYTLHYAQPNWAAYQEGAFNPMRRESGITHIKFVWPESGSEAGITKEVLFFDRDRQPQPDRDGTYGYQQVFDPQRRVVERIMLGADRQSTVSSVGIARQVLTYDALGNVTRIANLGRDGQPVVNASGVAEEQVAYDQHGNVKEITFFGTDGQLVTLKSMGATGRQFRYDERGNLIEGTFFGPNRQLVSGRLRLFKGSLKFATHTVVWDLQGRSHETYFGPDGKPILLFGRVAKVRSVWDARGYPMESAYFDEHDRPTRDDEGCAKSSTTYDEYGNLAESTCLDETDHAVRTTQGWAKAKLRYDERGNATEKIYFGPKGQLEFYEERYVKLRLKYNPQDKVIEQVYLDAADRPVHTNEGYAKITYRYNLQGHLIEVSFFDTQDRPTLHTSGYAQKRRSYDARGRLIEETFFDPQGNPVRNDDGYVKATAAYDHRGYRIETALFDEYGYPTLRRGGYATQRAKYNDSGLLLETAYIGLDGAPVLHEEHGYAKERRTYDARGNVTQIAYFDPHDQLVQTVYGYAMKRAAYDDLGRQMQREFLDINGALVHTQVAIWKFKPGSNGQRRGLEIGDLLLSYDGEDIGNEHIFSEMELVRGERPRELRIQRKGKIVTVDVLPGRLQGLQLVDRVPFASNKAGSQSGTQLPSGTEALNG